MKPETQHSILQKIRYISNLVALVASLLLLAGCNGALMLPKGEKLYNGAKVKVDKPSKKWDTKALEAALPSAVVLPRKNPGIFGLRPFVGVYNIFHNPKKEGGFRNWVANKIGKEPVLYNESIIKTHHDALKTTAANFGYFDIEVQSKTRGILRKRKLIHKVVLHAPAKTIESLNFPPADSGIVEQRLQQLKATSLLKIGAHYQLNDLALERQRLVDSLRNEGWFYLSTESLFFLADTLATDTNTVRLNLHFKDDVLPSDKRRYRIGKINIRPDHNSETEVPMGTQELVIDSCKTFIFKELNLKKRVILENIRINCGEYFSNEKYRETLFRLLNLQYFRFVNIRFDTLGGSDSLLVANVLLTPAIRQKVETSLSAVFSPSYYVGAQTGITLLNRNLLGAAELLSVSWEGNLLNVNDRASDNSLGKYWLIGSDTKVQLTLPQRIPGLRIRQRNALTATRFSLEHSLNFYQIDLEPGSLGIGFHKFTAKGSVLWKKNRLGTVTHELTPIGLSLYFTTFSDPTVKDTLISQIPTDSTGELLVFVTNYQIRPSYAFTYDNRLGKVRDLSTYFRQVFSLRADGFQLPAAVAALTDLGKPVNFITESIIGQYLKLNDKNILAYRFGINAGLPLTGKSYLALGDLYTIGGAASVRAFAPRTVGPGATQDDPSDAAFDNVRIVTRHSGNILLLGGVELRHKLGTSWEVAPFIDAGNTWLVQAQSESQASGVFAFDRFYRELASGAGLGIRYNLGIFVLRLDVAIPTSKPNLPVGSRLIGQPGFGSTSPRFNFAFGYPF